MAVIKFAFILLITLATLHRMNCQLAGIATSLPPIISLMDNLTDISPYMPQLAALLKDQKAEQLITNHKQDEIINLLQNQQETQNETAVTQQQMASSQEEMTNTLSEIAATQSQMASAQTQLVNAMNQMVQILNTVAESLQNQTESMQELIMSQTNQLEILDARLSPHYAQNCTDILDQGFNDNYGTYTIKPPDNLVSFQVACDLQTEGGGWIVFQRRFDGSVDFYRGWEDYKNGFGDIDGEHWLGLEKIHRLTSSSGAWQLRIQLEDFSGNTAYAQYDNFVIGNETTHYRLGVGAHSGTAGDSLRRHANLGFTTYDQDNDPYTGSRNCAQFHHGAWWYDTCAASNLNGLYVGSPEINLQGMWWWSWENNAEVLKKAEMKMRRM